MLRVEINRIVCTFDYIKYLTVGVKSKCSSDIKRIDHFVSLCSENLVSNHTVQKRSVYLYVWLAFTFTDVRVLKKAVSTV